MSNELRFEHPVSVTPGAVTLVFGAASEPSVIVGATCGLTLAPTPPGLSFSASSDVVYKTAASMLLPLTASATFSFQSSGVTEVRYADASLGLTLQAATPAATFSITGRQVVTNHMTLVAQISAQPPGFNFAASGEALRLVRNAEISLNLLPAPPAFDFRPAYFIRPKRSRVRQVFAFTHVPQLSVIKKPSFRT